jgi:hypothetical protein
MSFTPSFVSININENVLALPDAPERLPFVSFEERFEQEGKWLLGPMILAKICRHMEGRSLVVMPDPGQHNRLLASLPELPKVRNELNGEMTNIYWTIPEELRSKFEVCCTEAMGYRANDVMLLGDRILPCVVADQASAHRANAILNEFENTRIAMGDPNDPPLWECLAERFGLTPLVVHTMAEPFKDNFDEQANHGRRIGWWRYRIEWFRHGHRRRYGLLRNQK